MVITRFLTTYWYEDYQTPSEFHDKRAKHLPGVSTELASMVDKTIVLLLNGNYKMENHRKFMVDLWADY